MDGDPDLLAKQDSRAATNASDIVKEMVNVAKAITVGTMPCLFAEYTYMAN